MIRKVKTKIRKDRINMAIRNIREIGDSVLNKKCKEVKELTPRVKELVEDMLETMYDACGVGLGSSGRDSEADRSDRCDRGRSVCNDQSKDSGNERGTDRP